MGRSVTIKRLKKKCENSVGLECHWEPKTSDGDANIV